MAVRVGSWGHVLLFFFFSSRRRHTRFDCDWSSDVCSSDLSPSSIGYCPPSAAPRLETLPVPGRLSPTAALPRRPPTLGLADFCFDPSTAEEIGRASCRERV